MSDPNTSRERAFVSAEAEHLEQAANRLRKATFLSPSEERSVILTDVVAALERAADVLRSKV